MARKFNPFDTDSSFAGGGSKFKSGRYRVESSAFCLFDFGKGADSNTPCLSFELQEIDPKSGKDLGDSKMQYWSVTPMGDKDNTVELVEPIKGKKGGFDAVIPAEKSEYDKLWGGSDYNRFIKAVKQAYMEANEDFDDVSGASDFNGKVFEMSTIELKNTNTNNVVDDEQKKGAKKPQRDTRSVVTVTEMVAEGKAAAKKKAAKDDDDEPEEKPAKKGAAKSKTPDVGDEPDDICVAFMENQLGEDAKEGISLMNVKLALGKYATKVLDKDAEVADNAVEHFGQNLKRLFKAGGFTMEGKTITKNDD